MSAKDDAGNSVTAARLFLAHAERHRADNNAIDAVSRIYYACFHSMKAYLYAVGQYTNISAYVGHVDLISRYYEVYKRNQLPRAFTFIRKPYDTLKYWHRLREDMDYQLKETEFDKLEPQDLSAYKLMKIFIEQHIAFVIDKIK